jgi:hypothetical protein
MKKHLVIMTCIALIIPTALAEAKVGRDLRTELTGPAEAPGPGDADGSGKARLKIDASKGEICYKLRVKDIDSSTAAHIHRGAANVAGPIVVGLTPPSNGKSEACSSTTSALAKEILSNPSAFYINVHNTPFPRGAVRGQLASHNGGDDDFDKED